MRSLEQLKTATKQEQGPDPSGRVLWVLTLKSFWRGCSGPCSSHGGRQAPPFRSTLWRFL